MFDDTVNVQIGVPPLNAAFMEAQTEQHFENLAKEKIRREHLTPLSQNVLVKFGFSFNENHSGYHLGEIKVPLQTEQLQCSEWLLTAVQEDTALPQMDIKQ